MTDEGLIGRIQNCILDMRPNIQMDGGDLNFISYDDGIVVIRLSGVCADCVLMREMVYASLEERLKDIAPDIREIVISNDEL